MAFNPARILKLAELEAADVLLYEVMKDESVPRSHRNRMFVRRRKGQGAVVGVPYFWAEAYHDGRGVVTPRSGGLLIFWPDPEKDPRHGGVYPVSLSKKRRLTDEEFEAAFTDPDVVITAKPVGPWRGNPYFENALKKLDRMQILYPADIQVVDAMMAVTDRAFRVSKRKPNRKFRKAIARMR